MELKALCMKCRVDNKPQMRDMKNPALFEKKNRYSAKGQCAECGGNMFKFLSKANADKMEAEGATITHEEA